MLFARISSDDEGDGEGGGECRGGGGGRGGGGKTSLTVQVGFAAERASGTH